MRNLSINEYLQQLGYRPPGNEVYAHISEWLEWYQGDVEKFHKYKIFNGTVTKEERRHQLGMAKKVAEDWANLILNEKVAIKAGSYEKRLQEILEQNNFRVKASQLLELAYALGTGAFVEYLVDGEVVIDYIRADLIRPLIWENGEVIECAFGTYRMIEGKEGIYLQIHRRGKAEEGEYPDSYYIENHYVDVESGMLREQPNGVLPVIATGSPAPLFQILTPNICNNIDLDSPLGISVFANAIDQLKGCDLVYDSYMNEFILGKKRILVPLTLAKIQMQKDGIQAPAFDPEDNIYYTLPADRQENTQLVEIDMKIRSQEHELAIQRSLDLCSFKCGLGTGRFQFQSSGVKTATEVISDKSDLYQNLRKNELVVKAALIRMVKAVAFLDGKGEVDPSVDFDDSIIEDGNATIDRNIKLVQAGLRSKKAALMEINKYSEEEAQKELEEIAQDGQITGQDVDWTDAEEKADEEETEEDKDIPEKGKVRA